MEARERICIELEVFFICRIWDSGPSSLSLICLGMVILEQYFLQDSAGSLMQHLVKVRQWSWAISAVHNMLQVCCIFLILLQEMLIRAELVHVTAAVTSRATLPMVQNLWFYSYTRSWLSVYWPFYDSFRCALIWKHLVMWLSGDHTLTA